MSSLRRGAVAAVAALATVSLLAGCGGNQSKSNSDFNPISDVEYNPVNGISLDSTVVKVRNLYAIADEGILPARLRMTLVNTTGVDDALVGASLGRPAATGRLTGGVNGTVPVKAGTSVLVGSDLGAQITFPGLDVTPGTWVPVTLLFRDGRAVTGSVLLQTAVSLYSDGTVPQGRPSGRPTEQSVLPSGEAVNPADEAAQNEQGVEDQGNDNTIDTAP